LIAVIQLFAALFEFDISYPSQMMTKATITERTESPPRATLLDDEVFPTDSLMAAEA
jgi:hypothetical protein